MKKRQKPPRIILASSSPRRKSLMTLLGIPFEVCPPGASETIEMSMEPALLAERLALRKAKEVALKARDSLVIGADTVVVVDGLVLGKPKDANEAKQMLRMLSGRTHQVITGIAVCDTRSVPLRWRLGHEVTEVIFDELNESAIDEYVRTGEGNDKAGGYAIQGRGCVLVSKLNGCYFNVVGLPMFRLSKILSHFGVEVLGGS
ncbi:MAG: Maf family protein [Bacillota bacterium]